MRTERFNRVRFHVLATALLMTFVAIPTAVAQQRFDLEVPEDPSLHSKAVLDLTSLSITGPNGELTVYQRSPAHDQPGYIGWVWSAGRQFLRFLSVAVRCLRAPMVFAGDSRECWCVRPDLSQRPFPAFCPARRMLM